MKKILFPLQTYNVKNTFINVICETDNKNNIFKSKSCSDLPNIIDNIIIVKKKNKNKKSKKQELKKEDENFNNLIKEQLEYNNLEKSDSNIEEQLKELVLINNLKPTYIIYNHIIKKILLKIQLYITPILNEWIYKKKIKNIKNINNINKKINLYYKDIQNITLEWIDININNILVDKNKLLEINNYLQKKKPTLLIYDSTFKNSIEIHINHTYQLF